jgi:hypothetical protein
VTLQAFGVTADKQDNDVAIGIIRENPHGPEWLELDVSRECRKAAWQSGVKSRAGIHAFEAAQEVS